MVLKQLGAGPEVVHCQATLTLEALNGRAVMLVGAGGAGVIKSVVKYSKLHINDVFTACWYRNHSGSTHVSSHMTGSRNINPDSVLFVALEVGQGGTSCCCIVHCIHHQRTSLRLVVHSN